MSKTSSFKKRSPIKAHIAAAFTALSAGFVSLPALAHDNGIAYHQNAHTFVDAANRANRNHDADEILRERGTVDQLYLNTHNYFMDYLGQGVVTTANLTRNIVLLAAEFGLHQSNSSHNFQRAVSIHSQHAQAFKYDTGRELALERGTTFTTMKYQAVRDILGGAAAFLEDLYPQISRHGMTNQQREAFRQVCAFVQLHGVEADKLRIPGVRKGTFTAQRRNGSYVPCPRQR